MATKEVKAYHQVDKDFFKNEIYPKREPTVLTGLDIGPCRSKWTMDYLAGVCGDSEVKIHVCKEKRMDFITKNFIYRSLPFSELIRRIPETKHHEHFISEDEKYYLRSLGDNPRKDVADIQKQYPSLAEDVRLPPFFERSRFFSSVFRIASAGIQLWTHYDVMDNFLIVVSGVKRVVLFPPSDALYLYLNGDKSEVLDIDDPDLEKHPEFAKATKYECVLRSGDVLFIPAMWFHNVTNSEFGISVNVFWRHLDDSYYDGHDTYGNKDLLPAARALQVLDRALKCLDELPDEYRDFYGRRLITKINSRTLMKKK